MQQTVRQSWINKQMADRKHDFVDTKMIKVGVASCTCGSHVVPDRSLSSGISGNVNDKTPENTSLQPWLQSISTCDLAIIGFQELDLSADAMIRYTANRAEVWDE